MIEPLHARQWSLIRQLSRGEDANLFGWVVVTLLLAGVILGFCELGFWAWLWAHGRILARSSSIDIISDSLPPTLIKWQCCTGKLWSKLVRKWAFSGKKPCFRRHGTPRTQYYRSRHGMTNLACGLVACMLLTDSTMSLTQRSYANRWRVSWSWMAGGH
jgi:hypothetical protein